MSRDKGSESNHSETAILKLLGAHVVLILHALPQIQVVNGRFTLAREGLALQFRIVLDRFNDSTEEDKLGPPLWVGLQNGIDWVGGGNIVGLECSDEGREEPTNCGKHGGATVGKFSLAGVFNRNPFGQVQRVELKQGKQETVRKGSSCKT